MRIKHPTGLTVRAIRLLSAGIVVALLVAPALADREVSETVKAKADGVVTVENTAGAIEVVGWDRDEVKVEGTLTGDAKELVVDGGKKTRIEVKYSRRSKNLKGGADLVIHVPEASRLDVECISAGIEVHGVTGIIDAESISGDVTIGGNCRVVEAETISGRVTIDCEARAVSATSISGLVSASGRSSEVEAETVSGDIRLEFDTYLDLDVESVSGDATVNGDLDGGGNFGFELHSGTLKLLVPGEVNADFRITTFSGGIDNGFGQKARKTSKYAPGRELEFTNGNGDARVRIDTFSGDVVIRKR